MRILLLALFACALYGNPLTLFVPAKAAWATDLPRYFDETKIHISQTRDGLAAGDYVLTDSPDAAALQSARAKGATPILLFPAPRELARQENVIFAQPAAQNAAAIVAVLKATRENALLRTLSAAGRSVTIAPHSAVVLPHLMRPDGAKDRTAFLRWLNLPEPADPALPNIFLIGDSTVRNGRGDGIDGEGQWGWGDPLAAWFDLSKINLVNRAVGGTGARTFIEQGYWTTVREMIRPGDIVIMQFGHNDNGARGALPGSAEDTRDGVHTFGWYLRQYIAETRAKGATPVLCTLVPRNDWQQEKIARPENSHAAWTRAVAASEKALLLDLNELVAGKYDALGPAAVLPLFADKRVHTSREGAELNAKTVVEALRSLNSDPTASYQRAKPLPVW